MSQSITNKLIANIKQSSVTTNFSNSNNVVCIDTSNNRLGINTNDPNYSIEISNNSNINNTSFALKSPFLFIDNSANINELSCNTFFAKDISLSGITDISLGIFKTLSGNSLFVNELSGQTISGNYVFINDLSVQNISASCITISGNLSTIYTNIDICGTLTTSTFNPASIISNNISVEEKLILNLSATADFQGHFNFSDASGENLDCSNLKISLNADFSAINVENEVSCNSIISNEASFNELSCNILTISGNNIEQLITEKTNSGLNMGNDVNFGIINCSRVIAQDNNNYSRFNLLQIYEELRIPTSLPSNTTNKDGLLYANLGTNEIILIGSESQEYIFKPISSKKYVILDLSMGFVGNEISNNSINNFIIEANNLLIDLEKNGITNTYKKIYLSHGQQNSDIIILSDSTFIQIQSGITNIEINANISVQLVNKIPGDIEFSNYTFGLYRVNTDTNVINTSYVTIKNTVMSFNDNSYNYANSSISYILSTDDITSNSKLAFLLTGTSDTCLNLIRIDSFNATIKEL